MKCKIKFYKYFIHIYVVYCIVFWQKENWTSFNRLTFIFVSSNSSFTYKKSLDLSQINCYHMSSKEVPVSSVLAAATQPPHTTVSADRLNNSISLKPTRIHFNTDNCFYDELHYTYLSYYAKVLYRLCIWYLRRK